MMRLRDKRILLCVGGGIAAYKAAELTRQLIAAGAEVQIAMTDAAQCFIGALTLQALSRRPVATDLLNAAEDAQIGHIKIAGEADVVLVAPATADLIARMANGTAADMVTAAILACSAPVVVAPAMNTRMLEHPAVTANLERLASYGYRIVPPDVGELACGYEGAGRLPDAAVLLEEVAAALSPQDLAGCRVLVSAGPTREPIDAVRFLSNRSSGRMGYSVAAAARRRGAHVELVSGPVAIQAPRGCTLTRVETAAEMREAMLRRATDADVVVMVAAVADYRPAGASEKKIKKSGQRISIELEQTDDILEALARARGTRTVVGFAAETDRLRDYALEKLERKRVDLIVANDVSTPGCGFDASDNAALLIDRNGGEEATGVISKDALAERILDRVVALRADPRKRGRRTQDRP